MAIDCRCDDNSDIGVLCAFIDLHTSVRHDVDILRDCRNEGGRGNDNPLQKLSVEEVPPGTLGIASLSCYHDSYLYFRGAVERARPWGKAE